MNKSESKYFNTALLMDKALVELLKQKDSEYITVKEICEKAGVSRSTFYLHYETVSDLISETMELTMQRFQASFAVKPQEFVPNIQNASLRDLMLITSEYLHPYLAFVRENRALYKASFRNPKAFHTNTHLENVYQYVMLPIMDRFKIPKDEQQYFVDYYIYGCMAVIRRWVDNNCDDAIEAIESILIRCIRPGAGLAEDYRQEVENA